MALIQCKECGGTISDKATNCPHCGAPVITPKTVTCPECGQTLPEGTATCPNCGAPIKIGKAAPGRRLLGVRIPLFVIVFASAIVFLYSFITCFAYKSYIVTEYTETGERYNSDKHKFENVELLVARAKVHDTIFRIFTDSDTGESDVSFANARNKALSGAESRYFSHHYPYLILFSILMIAFGIPLVLVNKKVKKSRVLTA